MQDLLLAVVMKQVMNKSSFKYRRKERNAPRLGIREQCRGDQIHFCLSESLVWGPLIPLKTREIRVLVPYYCETQSWFNVSPVVKKSLEGLEYNEQLLVE